MKVLSISFLILNLILSMTVLYPDEYRIAIFDYDIRETEDVSVAQYIEQKLIASGLSFKGIDHVSGQQNERISVDTLRDLDQKGYDLIITITSDAMIPAQHSIKNTPWLFTNVNNPKFYGIRDLQNPGYNKSGVTYYIEASRQLLFFQEIMSGSLKNIGLIIDFNAGNKRAEILDFRNTAASMGISTYFEIVRSPGELPLKTRNLLSNNIDALILTSSSLIYDNADLIVPICTAGRVPVFSVNKAGVLHGAVAAYASDYFVMVDECLVPMVIDVLQKGIAPGDMPVRSLKEPYIFLNMSQAEALNLKIPDEILERASSLF